MNLFKLSFLLLLTAFVAACDTRDQKEIDRERIVEYLAENNLTATETNTGLFYIIETEGTGKQPTAADVVTVDYEGRLLNGNKFDSSYDRGVPLTSPLANLILGWQQGIPLFKVGGKGKLFVPSHLGYGSASLSGIPANSVLIFDIELLDVD